MREDRGQGVLPHWITMTPTIPANAGIFSDGEDEISHGLYLCYTKLPAFHDQTPPVKLLLLTLQLFYAPHLSLIEFLLGSRLRLS